jgi:ParB/RepB/Spo0J family partition protein
MEATQQVIMIPLKNLVVSKFNVRKEVGDISELIESVKSKGVLQPILVRSTAGGRYEIIAGSRRFAAATEARLSSIPAIVRKMSDQEAVLESVSENVQRQNLSLVEIVSAYNLVKDTITEEQFAKGIDKSKGWLDNILMAQNIMTKFVNLSKKPYSIGENPTHAERERGVIPYTIVIEVGYALKSDEVRQKFPSEKEIDKKRVELIEAVRDMPFELAKKFLERFKMYPEKSMSELRDEAEARKSFIPLPKTAVPPSVMRQVTEFAEESGKTIDVVMPEIVKQGVEIEKKRIEMERLVKDSPKNISEIVQNTENLSPNILKKVLQVPIERQEKLLKTIKDLRMNEEEALRHIDTVKEISEQNLNEELEMMDKTMEAYGKFQKDLRERARKPEVREARAVNINLSAHQYIIAMAERLSCPVCGSKIENLEWKCHHINIENSIEKLKRTLR